MTQVLESPQKYRDQLADRIGAEKADRHLIGMPRRYSLIYSLEDAERHARAADNLDSPESAISEVEELKNGVRVTVYAYDRSYLLSDICGVLAVSDFNILYADAYTRSDGTVVDIFGVGGLTENGSDRESQIARMEKAFQDVWSGSASVSELIEQHRRRWARRKMLTTGAQTHVVIDNQVSESFTVLDVFTLDRIGLLHDISRTISAHGVDIHMARIGTDGDRVADAFYITGEDGGKLVDEEQTEILRKDLLAVLESPRP
jgi:[protein-PII] uridylyltransferase